MKPQRVDILGVPVDCVTLSQSGDIVEEILAGDQQESVLAVNSEKVLRAREDERLLDCLRSTRLLIPDGIGAVLAARLLYGAVIERVPGADLMPVICEAACRRGAGVFLFGAKPEVNRETGRVLQAQFPGLHIAGSRDGYIDETEMLRLIEEINDSGAEVLFVALGSPRQEMWIHRYRKELRVRLIQGVGGSFDVISGYVKRAPALFRRVHLEWLYRIIAQPSKLPRGWINVKFGFKVLLAKFV